VNIKKKDLNIADLAAEKKRLLNKLASLEIRRKALMKKLGQTINGERANTRQSDRKFRENSARAVCARTKKADKAMLRTVETSIKLVAKKIRQIS
jgi:hypothetical protein